MVLFPYKSVFFPRSGHGGEPTHHPAPSLESNPTDATEEKGCWETGEQRRGAWVPKCRDRLGPGSMRATREAQFQGRVFQHHVCRYYCPDQQKHPLEGLLWYLDSAWLGRVSNKSKCNGASPLLTLCLPTSIPLLGHSQAVLGKTQVKSLGWRRKKTESEGIQTALQSWVHPPPPSQLIWIGPASAQASVTPLPDREQAGQLNITKCLVAKRTRN